MKQMPVLFVGHGSPMNAIEDNVYSQGWRAMGERILSVYGRPKAIVAFSAHWMTKTLCVRAEADNRQIYDMTGFPEALYQVQYAPAGMPELADTIKSMLGDEVRVDASWGIDHGVWSVLKHMFPFADVPVVMMSTPLSEKPEKLFQVGQRLNALRCEGVLLLGSGNIVHNLLLADYHMPTSGFPWAEAFDQAVKEAVLAKDDERLCHYQKFSEQHLAFQTPEHFLPLLPILGAGFTDDVEVWNEGCVLGALSMTSYLFTQRHEYSDFSS